MNQTIKIAFCIDEGYAQHLAVALTSLFLHNENNKPDVYIASPPLKPESLRRLKKVGATFSANLIFKEIQEERVANFREHLHLSRAAYFRILLSEILPEVDKLIYLDCDLVVEADLAPLWEIDLNGYAAAGVDEENPAQTSRLDLDDDLYINSGILVLNLAYWREHKLTEKCLEWISENPQRNILLDQDAINVSLKYKKKTINVMWNLNPVPLEDLDVLKKYPQRILHFGGPIKPWHKCYDFALQQIYKKYLAFTDWYEEFNLQEPKNIGQACLVANQFHNNKDYYNASQYYQKAIDYCLKTKSLDSKLLLDCINGGHRHFNSQDYTNACEHYRSCIEHWGYPLSYSINIYKMPGLLESMF